MSDFESESETELLVLDGGRRRFNYDSEYFNPRNRRTQRSVSMCSMLKNSFCG